MDDGHEPGGVLLGVAIWLTFFAALTAPLWLVDRGDRGIGLDLSIAVLADVATVVVAVAALAVSVGSQRRQHRLQRRQYQVEQATELLRRWDQVDVVSSSPEDILNFFEDVGFLARHGDVLLESVWISWHEVVSELHAFARADIAAAQEDDPTVWEEFVWLSSALTDYDERRRAAAVRRRSRA